MKADTCDVVIVGAGPYGLACAAHLRATKGLEVRVVGEPMSFWDEQMPSGMLLRSPYVASHIADPERSLTLDDYGSQNGGPVSRPVPLVNFVDYGRWFQDQIAPDLDRRWIADVAKDNGTFRVTFGDGAVEHARNVVVAAGVAPFASIPELYRGLPPETVSHSYENRDLRSFRGSTVVVVGGGQSALESAALLHEAGADVEVIVRAPRIFFLRRVKRLHRLGPLTSLLFAPAEVGPAGLSRLVSAPSWYRRLPRALQDRFAVRSLRPAGAAWLIPRLEAVPITVGRSLVSATAREGRALLTLDDGQTRTADHVLLATGYKVDIARYEFLSRMLLERVRRAGGYPRLSRTFESSVPGLYFVGAPAAWSYGPLMRFVAGTEFTAPTLARGLAGR